MQDRTQKVGTLVSEIRRRWRRRALVQGTALTLLVALVAATVLLLLHVYVRLPGAWLTLLLGAAGLAVLGVGVQYVVRPALRRISDRQIALYIEERFPELEDRLNSAIEVETAPAREHGILLDRLIDDAAFRARAIPLTSLIDRKRERILSYAAGTALVLFLGLGYTALNNLSVTSAGLTLSLPKLVPPPIKVAPGDVELEKGESQEVIAELRDEGAREVVLHYQMGEGAWQKQVMKKGLGEPVYLQEFLDIQEPIRYYVAYDAHRTDVYTISLYEFPDVAQIDLTYTYPAYTGRAALREEDGGDIRGLKGSTVTVSVRTTGTVEEAELVLDGERRLKLRPAGDGRFQGTLPIEADGSYTVRLTDRAGKHNKFPEEYLIVPVEDEKPRITITDPQRDVRANAIEEVLVAVSVEDDYGVRDVRLRYSVNGAEEQTLPLARPEGAGVTEVSGEHLFYLEDFGLAPGDVISYYVEAEDHFHQEAPEATDMYFIEVIPFDQRFSQAANMGGMPGGGQSGIVLSQQQIIAATWKLHRERGEMEPAAFQEALGGLVQAQANLKGEIEKRINSTAFSIELRANEQNRQIVGFLREAVREMDGALGELRGAKLQEALSPERRALNHLLKADALNKERQVALNNQQQGGGSMSAREERMTELMDLELDISKDKYEMQQQPAQARQEQELNEALRKVQELARRQENLVNQGNQQNLKGEDRKRFVDRLKRDQDELRQQTESLANSLRQQSRENPQLSREMEGQLERVAENMKQAEQSLRRGDTQGAMARQQQALNELERLREQLRLANTDNTRELMTELTREFEEMQEGERRLARDLEKAEAQARARQGGVDGQELQRLKAQRQAQREKLEKMQAQAQALQERARGDEADLAAAARDVLQRMRREELEKLMRDSENALEKGWLDFARRLEEEIQEGMEGVEGSMRALEGQLPVGEDEQIARALEDVRNLLREAERLQEQLARSASGRNQPGQNQPGQNQPGQNQPGQNQPGQNPSGQNPSGQNPSGQEGRSGAAQAAQLQRQLEQARAAMDRLQESLGGNAAAQPFLQELRRAFVRADNIGEHLQGEAAAAFFNKQVFDPLSQLELELARQLDGLNMEKKLYGGRRGDVPPEYRDLVEKYYESLAKSKRRP